MLLLVATRTSLAAAPGETKISPIGGTAPAGGGLDNPIVATYAQAATG